MSEDEYSVEEPAPDPDRVELPELKLPSGGWVRFNDPYSLKGKDVQALRSAGGSSTNEGEAGTAVLTLAAKFFVADWNIDYLTAQPLPRQNPKILGELTGLDLVALEDHMAPALEIYRNKRKKDDDDGPGSPYRPARG